MYSDVCRLNRTLDERNRALGQQIAQFDGPVLPDELVDEIYQLKHDLEIARCWKYEEENLLA